MDEWEKGTVLAQLLVDCQWFWCRYSRGRLGSSRLSFLMISASVVFLVAKSELLFSSGENWSSVERSRSFKEISVTSKSVSKQKNYIPFFLVTGSIFDSIFE